MYGDFINFGLYVVEDIDAASADLKKEFKTTKLPQFRFYPNIKKGDDKRKASFEIVFPKTKDMDKIRETVLDEIKGNFISDVKNVSEKVYHSLGAQNSKDGKVTVLLMYEGGTDINFEYQGVAASPYRQDDFVFMATDEPSEYLRGDDPLPGV